MPAARDYTCKECHFVFEHFGDTFQEEVNCPECEGFGVWTPSFHYASRAAQGFTPVVIHQDAAGNIRYPGASSAPVPAGFQRVELTTLHDVRRFEREVNAVEGARIRKDDYNRRVTMDQEIISNREAIREGVQVRDRENPDRVRTMRLEDFTPRGKQFYDHMSREADARRARNHAKAGKGPGFFLEAFSQDASNREAHRDRSNDWGRSGARK